MATATQQALANRLRASGSARAGVAAPVRGATPRARTALEEAWQYIGQVPAGLIQSTVADTSVERDRENERRIAREAPITSAIRSITPSALVGRILGNEDRAYRPAIMDTPGALYGVIQVLTQNAPDPNSFGQRALERVNTGYDRVNNALDIRDPENAAQTALNVAGGVLVPGTAPLKVTAATRLGRVAQRTRNFAAEAVLPLRNTSVPMATAVAGTLGVGIREVVETAHDDPNYTGIAEFFGGGQEQTQQADVDPFTAPLMQQAGGEDDPFTAPLSIAAPQLSSDDPFVASLSSTPDLVTRTPQDDAEDENDWLNWRNAVIAIGTVFAGGAAYRYARNRVRQAPQALQADIDNDLPSLRGLEIRRSRSAGRVRQRVRDATTSFFQHDQPVRDAARDFMSARYADELGWDLDRLVNVSLGSRVRNFTITGRAPGVMGKKYTRIAPVLETYGRELSPQQQQMVDDAILAARALDDRVAMQTNPSFTNVGDDELRRIVRNVQTDAQMGKYFDAAMQIGRDILDFGVRRGLLSNEVAARWVRNRPHWAPFDRAVTFDADMNELNSRLYTANKNAVSAQSATEDASSVQAGAVSNPFNALVDRWTNIIRMAEMNDVRSRFLRDMDGKGVNPATGKPWVRKLPSIEKADEENTHIIFNNGTREAYYVADPQLSRALHLMPRATAGGFEVARQMMQNFVTGPLGTVFNLFAAAKSPIYDAVLGMALRKPGMRVGSLNELLLGISNGRISLGALDPTALVSGPIGAVRYLWDGLKQQIGTALETELLRQNSWLRDMLGDTNVGNLARVFSDAYENSTRALMDELGITSHTLHGSPDPARPITNLQDIAPSFSTAIAQQLHDSVLKSGPGVYERVLSSSRNVYAQARASRIAHMYSELIEAMHNGFRYQALATMRKQRDFPQRARERAAQLRRLSGDAAQYGGSRVVNRVTGSVMYAGLTMQVLHEAAMMIRKHPLQFAINLGTMVPMIMGMHYLSMLTDDDARQAHMDKSPEQRTASVTMFGGAELPIDPLVRMVLSPAMALFDQLSGINDGTPNLDLMQAFSNLLDNDDDQEDLWHEMEQGFWANMWANNPVSPSGFPLTAPILANYGVDPGMTRFSGEAAPIRTQEISGADQDSAQVDALTTAWWQNMIQSLTGAFGSGLYGMANDYYRSLQGGSDVSDAVERAGERWIDTLHRGSGPYRPLFGQYEHVIAVGDGNWQQYNQKRDGIERALRVYNRDVRTSGTTSMSYPMPLPVDQPLPEFQGTVAALIGAEAMMLDRETMDLRRRLSQLGNQAEALRNSYVTTREEANRQLNQNTRLRRALALQLLQLTRAREERIGSLIGAPDFTFEDFDPREYQMPLPAPDPTANQTMGLSPS